MVRQLYEDLSVCSPGSLPGSSENNIRYPCRWSCTNADPVPRAETPRKPPKRPENEDQTKISHKYHETEIASSGAVLGEGTIESRLPKQISRVMDSRTTQQEFGSLSPIIWQLGIS